MTILFNLTAPDGHQLTLFGTNHNYKVDATKQPAPYEALLAMKQAEYHAFEVDLLGALSMSSEASSMLDAYLLDNAQKIKKTILFFETLTQQNEIIANGLRIIDENLDENNNLTVAIVEEIAKNSLQVYLKGEF